MSNCQVCNNELYGLQKKYCSNACKHQQSNVKYQNYEAQKKRSLDRKLKFIVEAGGKCSTCGYSRNLGALCFHHLDPTIKEYNVDSRQFSNRSIKALTEELSKCILLCANCHAELHYPTLSGVV